MRCTEMETAFAPWPNDGTPTCRAPHRDGRSIPSNRKSLLRPLEPETGHVLLGRTGGDRAMSLGHLPRPMNVLGCPAPMGNAGDA
jgi:hypothetical protein